MTSQICLLNRLFGSLTSVSLLMHWFAKLNSQSEWFILPTAPRFESAGFRPKRRRHGWKDTPIWVGRVDAHRRPDALMMISLQKLSNIHETKNDIFLVVRLEMHCSVSADFFWHISPSMFCWLLKDNIFYFIARPNMCKLNSICTPLNHHYQLVMFTQAWWSHRFLFLPISHPTTRMLEQKPRLCVCCLVFLGISLSGFSLLHPSASTCEELFVLMDCTSCFLLRGFVYRHVPPPVGWRTSCHTNCGFSASFHIRWWEPGVVDCSQLCVTSTVLFFLL